MTDKAVRRISVAALVGCGLLMALVIVAMLFSWRVRIDAEHDRHAAEHSRCLAANESRTALRDAFADDHTSLENLVESFIDPTSPEGRRFMVRLKMSHEAIESRLAAKLPVVPC